DDPQAPAPGTPLPVNPWARALAALVFWPIAALACLVVAYAFGGDGFTHGRIVGIAAGTGALAVLIAVLLPRRAGAHRARSVLPEAAAPRDLRYITTHFFIPWAAVNGLINGLLGYSSYAIHEGWAQSTASMDVFLPDVFGTAFVTSLCMIFSAAPHAE